MGRTTSEGHNQVRRFRRERELTQVKLAELVGVSRQTIVSIEGGDYAPSVYLALALADALQATVEALFADEDAEEGAADPTANLLEAR